MTIREVSSKSGSNRLKDLKGLARILLFQQLNHSQHSLSTCAVKNTIDLCIDEAEYKARMDAFKPTGPGETRGVLGKYAKLVATASEGAVTDKNL